MRLHLVSMFFAPVMSVVIFAVPQAGAPGGTQGGSSPRTVAKGDQSNIESPLQIVVRSEAEWADLWRRHAGGRERPPVDFAREMVVGVFMGSRPNAGFSTTIVSSLAVKGVLVVRYRETVPARDAVTAQILTFPYHLVAIAKTDVTESKFERVP
jgi:protease stability complex PrcB-like protein